MIRRAFLLMLFCSFAAIAAAQPSRRFSVNVQVSGDYASEAESYLRRELRSLGDVEVTDSKPQYSILLILRKTNSGVETGIAYSWLTMSHMDSFIMGLLNQLKSFNDPEINKSIAATTVVVVDHQLWFSGRDSLKKNCEEYIAKFDSKTFETIRKGLQKVAKP